MKNILSTALALTLFSCFEQGDCSDVSSNLMQVNFYNYSDKKTKTFLIDSVKMKDWDIVMYEGDSISTVKLPLNPAEEKMTFYFYYKTTVATLDVEYKSRSYALAPDCKAIDLITLLDGTATVIQDLKISQPELSSSVTENIKLYF